MRNRDLFFAVVALLLVAICLPGCTTTTNTYSERGADGSDIRYVRKTRVPIGGKIDQSGANARVKIDPDGGSDLQLSSEAIGQEGGDARAITAALIQAVGAGAQLGAIAMGAPGGIGARAASAGVGSITDDQIRGTFVVVRKDLDALQAGLARVEAALDGLRAAAGIYSVTMPGRGSQDAGEEERADR